MRGMTIRQRLRTIAIVSILLYTIVRFFFVKLTLESYGVNSWIFLVIDAGTGILYVIGIEHLITLVGQKSANWRTLFLWAGVTAISFAAPYVYIYVWSRELPAGIVWGLGVIILFLLVNAIFRLRQRMRQVRNR